MNLSKTVPDLPPQRWERPFDFPPGFWKRQLATKYLALAGRGDVDALGQLLAEHPEYLNKRGSHGRTLLWEAACRGRLAAVQWLVEQGADIDATGSYNGACYVQLTPYCAAIYYKRPAIADYLQQRGTQHDIFRAAFLGDMARVAEDLDANPELLHTDDPNDPIYFVPLLAFAIVGGQLEMVDMLLERGAAVAPYSAQLLYLAARDGRMDMVERLVAHGAEVPTVDAGIIQSLSDMDMMRYLLDHGAQINRPGKNGLTALMYIVRADKGEHPEKVRLLLEYGAVVNAVDSKGQTALHYVAAAGFVKVLALLLDHGADSRLRDHEGMTALDIARARGKTEAVALLIRRGTIS